MGRDILWGETRLPVTNALPWSGESLRSSEVSLPTSAAHVRLAPSCSAPSPHGGSVPPVPTCASLNRQTAGGTCQSPPGRNPCICRPQTCQLVHDFSAASKMNPLTSAPAEKSLGPVPRAGQGQGHSRSPCCPRGPRPAHRGVSAFSAPLWARLPACGRHLRSPPPASPACTKPGRPPLNQNAGQNVPP